MNFTLEKFSIVYGEETRVFSPHWRQLVTAGYVITRLHEPVCHDQPAKLPNQAVTVAWANLRGRTVIWRQSFMLLELVFNNYAASWKAPVQQGSVMLWFKGVLLFEFPILSLIYHYFPTHSHFSVIPHYLVYNIPLN